MRLGRPKRRTSSRRSMHSVSLTPGGPCQAALLTKCYSQNKIIVHDKDVVGWSLDCLGHSHLSFPGYNRTQALVGGHDDALVQRGERRVARPADKHRHGCCHALRGSAHQRPGRFGGSHPCWTGADEAPHDLAAMAEHKGCARAGRQCSREAEERGR